MTLSEWNWCCFLPFLDNGCERDSSPRGELVRFALSRALSRAGRAKKKKEPTRFRYWNTASRLPLLNFIKRVARNVPSLSLSLSMHNTLVRWHIATCINRRGEVWFGMQLRWKTTLTKGLRRWMCNYHRKPSNFHMLLSMHTARNTWREINYELIFQRWNLFFEFASDTGYSWNFRTTVLFLFLYVCIRELDIVCVYIRILYVCTSYMYIMYIYTI